MCGATNIAPGQRVPVALPGAVLPGDRRIERTEKMGVVSNGMLCSGDELRLTADADGILILPAGDARSGCRWPTSTATSSSTSTSSPTAATSCRMIGLAREVAAVTGARRSLPGDRSAGGGRPDRGSPARSTVEEPALCPRFVARAVSGVTVGPSPDQVQMRLIAAGQRPVSNVVDVSNYVMLELGKPIHTFDAAAVHDGRIIVRLAREGERLETLDHVERELEPETLLIADPAGPLGIAGVMGGATSEVSAATTDVVVESAIFDPVSIRRTAFRYALRSEASLRFEKGQEHRLARLGADRTARLIEEWAGGTVANGVDRHEPDGAAAGAVAFRPARVNRLLGVDVSAEEQRALLSRVGIATDAAPAGTRVIVAGGPDPLEVDVPESGGPRGDRPDLAPRPRHRGGRRRGGRPGPRLRAHPGHPAGHADAAVPPSPLRLRDTVREVLAGAGLSEAVSFALVSPAMVERFPAVEDPVIAGEGAAGGRPVTVTNPLSSQHSVMRQRLFGSLLEVASTNVRQGRPDVALFEIGKGYGALDDGEGTHEWWRLGFVLTGPAEIPAWNRPARPYDLDDAKGLIELVARSLGMPQPAYTPLTDDPLLHPGRAATRGGLGRDLGARRRAPSGAHRRARVASGAGRRGGARDRRPVRRSAGVPLGRTPSRHPVVERDLAVVVADARAASEVEAAIHRHAGPLLASVELFDIYRGRPLPDERRSLAFRLVFAAADRTLTEEEVDRAVADVAEGLASDVDGHLRT